MVEKRDKGEHGAKTGAKEKKKKLKLTTPELMQRAVDQLRIWQADRSAELSCPPAALRASSSGIGRHGRMRSGTR